MCEDLYLNLSIWKSVSSKIMDLHIWHIWIWCMQDCKHCKIQNNNNNLSIHQRHFTITMGRAHKCKEIYWRWVKFISIDALSRHENLVLSKEQFAAAQKEQCSCCTEQADLFLQLCRNRVWWLLSAAAQLVQGLRAAVAAETGRGKLHWRQGVSMPLRAFPSSGGLGESQMGPLKKTAMRIGYRPKLLLGKLTPAHIHTNRH